MLSIKDIPHDVLGVIRQFLKPVDIEAWAQTSKEWCTLMHVCTRVPLFMADCTTEDQMLWAISHLQHPKTAKAFRVAVRRGYYDVMHIIMNHAVEDLASNKTVCEAAVLADRLDVLKWLRAKKPPFKWGQNVTATAVRTGNLVILAWLREQEPPCPWSVQRCLLLSEHMPNVSNWVKERAHREASVSIQLRLAQRRLREQAQRRLREQAQRKPQDRIIQSPISLAMACITTVHDLLFSPHKKELDYHGWVEREFAIKYADS